MNNKKRIGILTTYYANFGSFFQATSLQNALEKLGYEVELINEQSRLFISYKMFLAVLITPFLIQPIREYIAKHNAQYYAYLRLMKDVKKVKKTSVFAFNMKKMSKKYDCVVVGSDELWSANKKTIAYYAPYFGHSIQCKHITYAPSATMFEGCDEDRKKEIQEGLKTFEAISVRDTYTQNFVKDMIGLEAELVIDPTLLNPYFLPQREEPEEKYALVYGQHYSEEEIALICQFAKERGLKTKSVAWRQDWCDSFLDTKSAADMQKAFANSEFCFPSTFHGTIFSILNHRNFVSFINPLRGRKVNMLLETLGLTNRISDGRNIGEYDEIDFAVIDGKIEELRKNSMRYLTNALNGEE